MADPLTRRRPLLGVVTAFDPDRALGTVRSDAGDELAFHSTAIADGTRTIEVGARVAFVVVPARRGAMEAAGLAAV